MADILTILTMTATILSGATQLRDIMQLFRNKKKDKATKEALEEIQKWMEEQTSLVQQLADQVHKLAEHQQSLEKRLRDQRLWLLALSGLWLASVGLIAAKFFF